MESTLRGTDFLEPNFVSDFLEPNFIRDKSLSQSALTICSSVSVLMIAVMIYLIGVIIIPKTASWKKLHLENEVCSAFASRVGLYRLLCVLWPRLQEEIHQGMNPCRQENLVQRSVVLTRKAEMCGLLREPHLPLMLSMMMAVRYQLICSKMAQHIHFCQRSLPLEWLKNKDFVVLKPSLISWILDDPWLISRTNRIAKPSHLQSSSYVEMQFETGSSKFGHLEKDINTCTIRMPTPRIFLWTNLVILSQGTSLKYNVDQSRNS